MYSLTKITSILSRKNIDLYRHGIACARNITAGHDAFQIYHQLVRSTTCGPPGKTKVQEEEHSIAPYYKRIAKNQIKFQVKDGVPIHLKGGAVDKILYQTTLLLCWIGTIMTFKTLYDMSYSKVNK